MKIQRTFTIDVEICQKFDKIAKLNSINKSLFFENSMKKFIEDKKNQNMNDNNKESKN